jgi:hypothetical protein
MPGFKSYRYTLGALALALLFAGCREESRWDAVQKETQGKKTSVSEDAIPGKVFNRFFPKQEEDYKIVFKQEKPGFAQAALEKDGDELAMFSIFDTISNPDARSKYNNATEHVEGFPVVTDETKSLSALVGGRFQVQVRSSDPGFGKSLRMEWLEKFDLKAISEIE